MSEATLLDDSGDWARVATLGDTTDAVRAATLDAYRELFPDINGEAWLLLVARLELALPGIMAGMANPGPEPVTHLHRALP